MDIVVFLSLAMLMLRCEATPLPKVMPYPEKSFDYLTKNGMIRKNKDVLYDQTLQKNLKETQQDPEVYPGLWEGDIAGISTEDAYSNWRIGLRWDVFPERKWINNTVPYHISHKYAPNDRVKIQSAIYTLSMMTCINFVPYDGEQEDYLLIWPVEKPAGCWSFIGRVGGQQVLSLQPPDARGPKCLAGPGKPIHEILHALGIFHEQSRADRDDHVHFFSVNVIQPFLHNFDKQSLDNTTFIYDYDYNSIMHYGPDFFSVGKNRPTLLPKGRRVAIGQRQGLSRTDCYKINSLYSCFDTSPYDQLKYESFCDILGL